MNYPNFLVVGAAKSGTTSIYNYLKKHPEVYLSDRKEGVFFSEMEYFKGPFSKEYNNIIIRDIDEYTKLFMNADKGQLIGDISPDYLYYYENSIKNIKKYLPNEPKIIIILRNPIDRAYSNYTFYVKKLMESESFLDALILEDDRKTQGYRFGYRYKEIGLYYDQVNAYKENFKNVLVLDFEELQKEPKALMDKITNFLGISNDFEYDEKEIHNKSGMPKFRFLHKLVRDDSLLKRTTKKILQLFFSKKQQNQFISYILNKNIKKQRMTQNERDILKQFFKDDILKLQDLVEFDVMKWLK